MEKNVDFDEADKPGRIACSVQEPQRHYLLEKAMYLMNIHNPNVKLRMPVVMIT